MPGDVVPVPGEPADDDGEPAGDVAGGRGAVVAPLVAGLCAGADPVVPGAATTSRFEADDEVPEPVSAPVVVVGGVVATVTEVCTPAKAADVGGSPSTPMTTGESPEPEPGADDEDDASRITDDVPGPIPETTGIARTRPTTVVVTRAPSAKRPGRAGTARRSAARTSSDHRVSAPWTRAESGGPEGRWCTGDLTGLRITNRYRDETIGTRKVTVSPG
ncbi:hypothetical protein GCM10010531_02140 [Blastococcus jejuensis]|uniref:Uncharacterized protein n=1 Tax=Blastococcus jejuensis TaxID=351224 RepID=A0ABP6NPC7_9ACTN